VFFDPTPIGLTADAVLARMQDLPIPISFMGGRIVVHHQISPEAVQVFLTTVKEMKEAVEAGKGEELRTEGENLDDSIKMPQASVLRMRAAVGY
jgi:threonine aldolase